VDEKLHSFLNPTLVKGKWSVSGHGHFIAREQLRFSMNGGLAEFQGQSGRLGENRNIIIPLQGTEPQTYTVFHMVNSNYLKLLIINNK
jgi:hypothetical protein